LEREELMKEWNILATAAREQERYLLRFLNTYGEFKGSGFRDVVLGRVEETDVFLRALEDLREENPIKLNPLSQIVPLEKTFHFDLSDFKDKLKEVLSSYVDRIENKKFYLRVKRRGHKGEISSLEVEKEVADFIMESLEKAGKKAQVSFSDPDCILIVETIGNWAGVGFVTKEMKQKYSLIKIK
jgi:tRNA(Ser,Leu) C12 N-acetylase TAN1